MSMKAHIELEVEIDYDTSPAEPQTLNYPGCDAELTIISVLAEGKEILDALTLGEIESLERQAREHETAMNDPDNREY